ncbi:hypothetical protein sr16702 [Sporisorium reilianum SRZ2]|uniref:Uncharacterized protein n=1 Tax=Sporisorium reilianum (strain SRZ2) TaxID=999809 RepID=E6ZVN6_SPORE|nr:hypothetical protein sr16702 [Sporisorium reilianum SRZ2]
MAVSVFPRPTRIASAPRQPLWGFQENPTPLAAPGRQRSPAEQTTGRPAAVSTNSSASRTPGPGRSRRKRGSNLFGGFESRPRWCDPDSSTVALTRVSSEEDIDGAIQQAIDEEAIEAAQNNDEVSDDQGERVTVSISPAHAHVSVSHPKAKVSLTISSDALPESQPRGSNRNSVQRRFDITVQLTASDKGGTNSASEANRNPEPDAGQEDESEAEEVDPSSEDRAVVVPQPAAPARRVHSQTEDSFDYPYIPFDSQSDEEQAPVKTATEQHAD